MKKLASLILFAFVFVQPAYSWDFSAFVQKNSEQKKENEIVRFINKQVKYANKTDLKRFISTYDDSYLSNDGIDKEKYESLVKDVWSSFKDIKYGVSIKNIEILDENNAKVELIETTYAEINLSKAYQGELKSKADSVYYLKKDESKRWKVVSDKVLNELTTMLYGTAKNLDIKITVPQKVETNSDYTASLEFALPQDCFAVASIVADKVEYPQKPVKEVFRVLPEDNILERIFTSNTENSDEYVIATVGLTKTAIKDLNIQLSLTGFGYAIKRVNVVDKEVEDDKIK